MKYKEIYEKTMEVLLTYCDKYEDQTIQESEWLEIFDKATITDLKDIRRRLNDDIVNTDCNSVDSINN